MKKLTFALAAFVALTLMVSSCSNDDCFGDDLKPCEKSCIVKKDSTKTN